MALVPDLVAELGAQRAALDTELDLLGLRVAVAGTHPFTEWHHTVVGDGQRQRDVYGSMRELARREPTFALHVHVGIDDPEDATRVANRMRAHLPMLLALSANSPFWQGRDTGLASARTPLFQAFPRVGIPRAFAGYEDYVEVLDLLLRCDAFADPTFLWWDLRLQPKLGTVEIRIMDAQSRVDDVGPLVALVQSLVRLELEEGYVSNQLASSPEVLDENRFLAARDGVSAEFVDPDAERRVALTEQLAPLLEACADHATDLGCRDELRGVAELAAHPPAGRQLRLARQSNRLAGPRREPGRAVRRRRHPGGCRPRVLMARRTCGSNLRGPATEGVV
ncbi:MAG: carboxylate-amine ligase [Solirubrobacterales bacterium]